MNEYKVLKEWTSKAPIGDIIGFPCGYEDRVQILIDCGYIKPVKNVTATFSHRFCILSPRDVINGFTAAIKFSNITAEQWSKDIDSLNIGQELELELIKKYKELMIELSDSDPDTSDLRQKLWGRWVKYVKNLTGNNDPDLPGKIAGLFLWEYANCLHLLGISKKTKIV